MTLSNSFSVGTIKHDGIPYLRFTVHTDKQTLHSDMIIDCVPKLIASLERLLKESHQHEPV